MAKASSKREVPPTSRMEHVATGGPYASGVSRIHDVGGLEGFGPIELTDDDAPFHADWEARVFALNSALVRRGTYSLDEFRDAVERISPPLYLASSYYERWFIAIQTLLDERDILSRADA